MCSAAPHPVCLGFHPTKWLLSAPSSARTWIAPPRFRSASQRCRSLSGGKMRKRRQLLLPMASFSFDEDSMGIPTLVDDGYGVSGEDTSYMSSSDDEDYDADLLVSTVTDVELASNKDRYETSDPSLTVTAHRFATLTGRRRRRTRKGMLISMTLVAFLVGFLLFFDWCSWQIVRMPLEPFFLTHPFTLSAVISAFAGFLFVPIVDTMRIYQIIRKDGPTSHWSKKGTPIMGGLFFIPVAIAVASVKAGNNSAAFGAVIGTISFATIGLFDDLLSCNNSQNSGLPGWAKFGLQIVAGTLFSFWLDSAHISTPYNMKFLVPLPPPLGLVYLGKFYLVLTASLFVSMSNGVNMTDGLDGLAGGCAALAFMGMSIAVLPINPELAIFGSSMCGACIGFLFHNRHKASVFMGDVGALALGGALAAMAALSGMFFPLFISSGIFMLENLSVIMQVFHKRASKLLYKRKSRRGIVGTTSIYHYFELCGVQEPLIVGVAYIVSFILALVAGYVGLISA
ncbi:phospho-N-acetylmuramoyl-pentapeptide-transferase homolog [Zingiber officinale]|uniref:phospho-N-acetylmuramoyl-pentapeptide- transferase homolog n=1 Tax=Zingiber officinale TaxID=94328 RepID=UPI001C4D7082|nr:phospho-N-acetylmuramoyl-pentapeptide-transferase homolog [Zingiber officinale]XP_042427745.1 phospho-N-acetylmuramoyl-pentapeptide-transferase homolog [Zingiber officinale]XP_042427746.1 phospho-N-acetylmuramoyl-pentapeptide-transferase homolog [Zingiber officinale]